MSDPKEAQPDVFDVIERCLREAAEGDYFDDWEFHTLFGLDRIEVATVLAAWPALPETYPSGYDSPTDFQHVAVNNAMNNLLGYPHGVSDADLESRLGASMPTIAAVLRAWRGESSLDATVRDTST